MQCPKPGGEMDPPYLAVRHLDDRCFIEAALNASAGHAVLVCQASRPFSLRSNLRVGIRGRNQWISFALIGMGEPLLRCFDQRDGEAALSWMVQYGDRDGDGYLDYSRRNGQRLVIHVSGFQNDGHVPST